MRLIDADDLCQKLLRVKEKSVARWIGGGAIQITSFIDMLIEAINKVPTIHAQSDWISVKERMPDEQVRVLVHYDNGRIATGARGCFGAWSYQPGGERITHWMPLPEPPVILPPEGAAYVAKLGTKRIWVDKNGNFVAPVD